MKPTCPNCGSTDVTFRSKKQCYICDDCNSEFIPEQEFEALRIFISYGHDEHAAFAQKLADDVKEKGHEVWFDLNRLKPGGDWERYIEEGLNWTAEKPGSGRIILIMTPHSVRRPLGYCLNEIAWALDHHLFILPVMLVWCTPPLSINRIQWLDMQHCATGTIPDGRYITSKNRLFEAIENQRIDFEGQTSLLKNNLNPLSFEADVIHYQKWFMGREWVFDKIKEWLKTPSASRLFWITGLPGIGKTAIAIKLIQQLENLVAFHLCRRGNNEKASPRRAVMSISYQLSTQLPDYADKLAGINLAHLLSDPNVNASALFDALLIEPLATDIQRPDSPRIILIDGLDEATSDGRNLLAEFIASEFKKLPDWLRIIITSRPDPEVTVPLQEWERWTLETQDPKNQQDLELYISTMLSRFSSEGISNELLTTIVQNSEGIFLYAEWVCREIIEGRLSVLNPQDFPKGLGGIYDGYFKKKLTREGKYQDDIDSYKLKIRPAFELIIAAREPLPLTQLSKWLCWKKYDEESFFKNLGSLFFVDSIGCVRPFHASVLDWLSAPAKAGDFFVNAEEGNQSLTKFLWDEYLHSGEFSLSVYALRYLPTHLIKLKRWDDLTTLLCHLDFIQAKSAMKMTYELMDDFHAALQTIPDNDDNIKHELENQSRLDKYAKDLILFANGELEVLDVPESATPWDAKKIKDEIDRIKKKPTRLDNINSFYQFMGQNSGTLQKYAHELEGLAIQQAWNNYDSGPVGNAASGAPMNALGKLMLRTSITRPPWIPLPQAITTLKGHTSGVEALATTPDGKRAISGAGDNTCILWDLTTGQPIFILHGHTSCINAVAITPDGKWAFSGAGDNTCIFWNLTTGQPIKTLHGHSNWVRAVAITPNGEKAISGASDNTCIFWDLTTGEPIFTLNGHTNWVRAVSITSNGERAISGSADHTCIHWNLISGEKIHTLKGHTFTVSSVAITPDGGKAISGSFDKNCILWDLSTGNYTQILEGHTENVFAVDISPDGQKAVSGSDDNTCIFWDLTTGKPINSLKGHTSGINSVSISPDGKWVLSGSADNTCILFNLISGQSSIKYNGHNDWVTSVSITLDGKMAVSGSDDKTCILWDLKTGQVINTLKGHNSTVEAVAFTADGNRVISGSDDRTCILWDSNSGQPISRLNGHSGKVKCLAITPDGKRAISGSDDKSCILWDLTTGKPIYTLKGHSLSVEAIAITPDGKRVITGSKDNNCILWDITTGKKINTLVGHTSRVHALAITPDGKWAVSGSRDKTCIIWDLRSGKAINTFRGHTDDVITLAITPDGKKVFSGSADQTCILWDIESQKKISQFITSSTITAISYFSGCVFGGENSFNVFILKVDKELLNSNYGIITVKSLWNFEKRRFQEPSVVCQKCGQSFTPPALVMETIMDISKRTGLLPYQSQCLELPPETWDEPGLVSTCPKCGEKIKFNPFVVVGSDETFLKTNHNEPIKGEKFDNRNKDVRTKHSIQTSNYKYLKQIEFLLDEMRIDEALEVLSSTPIKKDESIQNAFGVCHLRQGNYEIALEYFFKLAREGIFSWKDNAKLIYKRNYIVTLLLLNRVDWRTAIQDLDVTEQQDEGIQNIIRCCAYWENVQKQERNKAPLLKRLFGKNSQIDTFDIFDFPLGELDIPQPEFEPISTEYISNERDNEEEEVIKPEQLRNTATELYLNGKYEEAKEILKILLGTGFEPLSIRMHLARIAIMIDNITEAAYQTQISYSIRKDAAPYVLARILWFKLCLSFMKVENEKEISIILGQLKSLLQNKETAMEWSMKPVMENLKPRLQVNEHALLTTLVAAMSNYKNLTKLNEFPIWLNSVPLELEYDDLRSPYDKETQKK